MRENSSAVKPRHSPLPPDILEFARQLRHEGTDAEACLWFALRDRRMTGCKFRRQQPVGPYILDFYCHDLKLAIELDGGQHNDTPGREHDERRTAFLEAQGISVLRFWNNDVLQQPESVLEAIFNTVSGEAPSSQPFSRGEKGSICSLRPGEEAKEAAPHQLMMSATPIPRTLAMSYYADLDVSVLDELPPGRTPVLTKLVSDARRDEVVLRVKDACAEGRQAYWVCPLIEESEALELQTAIDTHERLSAELTGLNVGLVHGRLKPAEKAAVMAAFVSGEVDLLVATTVIEVGVDVPNASLMVIEHAERFGLSQLHQLRGRVGRGTASSACILLFAGPLGQIARERLKIMFETNDGFEVSRRDLELRGPGEFIGARQSGVPMLRFASLEDDADLLDLARKSAEWLLKDHPEVVETHLARWLGSKRELLKA